MTVAERFPETADIETSSEEYATRFAGPAGAWFLQVQEQATLQMLAPFPGASVLDVGGGHGQTAATLVEHGYDLTVLGSDATCKARIGRLVDAGQCDFRVGNIIDLPFEDQSFDVVLSYRLLPHVTRWQAFLAALGRVARKAVILDYPEVRSVNSIAPFLFQFKKRIEGNTRPYTCFGQKQLAVEFKQHGFLPSGRYAEFFLPMVVHRKIGRPAVSKTMERLFRVSGFTRWFGSPVILRVSRTID